MATGVPSGGGGGGPDPGIVLNDVHLGTVELHIGSVWLQDGQTIGAAASCLIGTTAGGTAFLRMRRFTGGGIIFTMSVTTTGLGVDIIAAPVSITADDYYDILLYGGDVNTESVAKSLFLDLS